MFKTSDNFFYYFSSFSITFSIFFFIPFPSAQLKLFITKLKWVSCFHLLKFEVQRLNAFIQWHFPKGKGYFSWCIEEHLERISVRGKSVQIFCLLLFLASFCYLSELPSCALRALYSSASRRCRALIATEYSGRAAERRKEICQYRKGKGLLYSAHKSLIPSETGFLVLDRARLLSEAPRRRCRKNISIWTCWEKFHLGTGTMLQQAQMWLWGLHILQILSAWLDEQFDLTSELWAGGWTRVLHES